MRHSNHDLDTSAKEERWITRESVSPMTDREDITTKRSWNFPDGARFAFTVLDDTDDATLTNIKPIYDYLAQLGLRTTKTVWPFRHEGPSHFDACETLEDVQYLEYMLELRDLGFEISWHCATFESSKRERTLAALERFRDVFHVSPRVHANHALNAENLYWGPSRVDSRLLSWLLGFFMEGSLGHVESSPYWWGDAAREHVRYTRNLTFNRLNVASINPSMPYSDASRPLSPLWFSASDAESVEEFNRLTSPENQERLESEGGFTVIATHFGKGFVQDGEINSTTRENLAQLAARPGWFPSTGELLDWLVDQGGGGPLTTREWHRMQFHWAWDLLRRKLRVQLGTAR